MTPDEFGAKIKAKYPDYADMDNTELSRRIVAKHPDYASQVDFSDAKDAPNEPASNPLGGFGDAVLGVAKLMNPLASMTPDNIMGQARSADRALLTNEPTQGFGEAMLRSAPATAGGMMGGLIGAPAGFTSVPGAALGAAGGEGLRQSAVQLRNLATGQEMASPGQVAGNMGIQGALSGLGAVGGNLTTMIAKKAGPAIVKGASQLSRAASGMPEQTGAAIVRDPGMIARAKPIAEAGRLYREGVGDAANGSLEAGRAVFGKTYPGPEAAVNTFDEMRPVLDAAKPEELLGMRQTLSDTLQDTPRTAPKLRMMLSERLAVLDDMLESRLPDWGGAKQAWRDSKVAEEAGSWLPLNKNLSPNALRTTAAVSIAASKAAEGNLLGLAALPFISPKVWSVGLRGLGYAGQAANAIPPAVYRVGTQAASGATGSALADAYMRQQVAR